MFNKKELDMQRVEPLWVHRLPFLFTATVCWVESFVLTIFASRSEHSAHTDGPVTANKGIWL